MEYQGHDKQAQQDHDLLIELKAKVDAILSSISNIETSFIKKHDDHEGRIRALEQTRWTWGGAIAAVSVAASSLLSVIFK